MWNSRAARRYTPLGEDDHAWDDHSQKSYQSSRQRRPSPHPHPHARVSFADESPSSSKRHPRSDSSCSSSSSSYDSYDGDKRRSEARSKGRYVADAKSEHPRTLKDKIRDRAQEVEKELPGFSTKALKTELTVLGLAAVGLALGSKLAELDGHVASKKKEKRSLRGTYQRTRLGSDVQRQRNRDDRSARRR